MTAAACVDPDRLFIDRRTGMSDEEISAKHHVPVALVKSLLDGGGAAPTAPASSSRASGACQRRPSPPPGAVLRRRANAPALFVVPTARGTNP